MNALELLKQQHREVSDLFEEFEAKRDRRAKERICHQISDALAVHATIEEQIFYPEAKQENTEKLLREAVEEHLSVKKLIAEIMGSQPDDPQYDAKLQVLEEQVEHHVEEEEKELFPLVKKNCSKEELSDMGERMQRLADELQSRGSPSSEIPGQTDQPAPI